MRVLPPPSAHVTSRSPASTLIFCGCEHAKCCYLSESESALTYTSQGSHSSSPNSHTDQLELGACGRLESTDRRGLLPTHRPRRHGVHSRTVRTTTAAAASGIAVADVRRRCQR
jgi:hypothetical protein